MKSMYMWVKMSPGELLRNQVRVRPFGPKSLHGCAIRGQSGSYQRFLFNRSGIASVLSVANVAGTSTYSAAVPVNVSTNQTLERIDQNIGDKARIFVRYDWQNTTIVGGVVTPTSGSFGPANNRNIAIGYTQIMTPDLVNDFRFGRNHLMTNNLNYWAVNGLNDAGTQLGIPGFDGDTRFGNPGIPDITGNGYMGLGNAGSN
jgi:hypothetical protein